MAQSGSDRALASCLRSGLLWGHLVEERDAPTADVGGLARCAISPHSAFISLDERPDCTSRFCTVAAGVIFFLSFFPYQLDTALFKEKISGGLVSFCLTTPTVSFHNLLGRIF